jgi:hypothetical protein
MLTALLSLTACDSSSGPDDMAVPDMSMSGTQDLLVKDLSPVAADSCAALAACGSMCTPSNISTCGPACLAAASTTAQGYFSAIQDCTKAQCNNSDAGITDCNDFTSTACKSCLASKCAAEIAACEAH